MFSRHIIFKNSKKKEENTMSLQVIGKAAIDMEKFRAFRKEEREKAKNQNSRPALW